jgi:mono/diheme cytochrome c family protein
VRRLLLVAAAVAGTALLARAYARPPLPQAVRMQPRAADADTALARGRSVYERYGCAMCHGADGKGGFANANAETEGKVPGVVYVAEGFTPAELRRKLLDGAATVGRADPNGPRPPYRMPGWKGQMSDQEADDLVRYLMSLYPKSAEEKWR